MTVEKQSKYLLTVWHWHSAMVKGGLHDSLFVERTLLLVFLTAAALDCWPMKIRAKNMQAAFALTHPMSQGNSSRVPGERFWLVFIVVSMALLFVQLEHHGPALCAA